MSLKESVPTKEKEENKYRAGSCLLIEELEGFTGDSEVNEMGNV